MSSPSSAQKPAAVPMPPHRARHPWRGVEVMFHRMAAHEVLDAALPVYAIDLNVNHAFDLEWKHNGAFRSTWMAPGALCIAPAHESVSMRWRSHVEVLSVYLEPSWLVRTAEELKLKGAVEIPEQHGNFDTQVEHLCRALWAESQAGYPTGRLFGESLGAALSGCLLQRHGVRRAILPRDGKLSARQWARLRDYVEEHLEDDISLDAMAEVVQLSPYHFSRCFKATVGTSPHQYVIARRVERARQLLTCSSTPIAQVAFLCGFADQSHLTRHMKRHLGVTPAALLAHSQKKSKNVQ